MGTNFAKPRANDRAWGALDKLAVTEPAVFAEYFANDIIALISESCSVRITRSPHRSMCSTLVVRRRPRTRSHRRNR